MIAGFSPACLKHQTYIFFLAKATCSKPSYYIFCETSKHHCAWNRGVDAHMAASDGSMQGKQVPSNLKIANAALVFAT